jgi:hypothetical protein
VAGTRNFTRLDVDRWADVPATSLVDVLLERRGARLSTKVSSTAVCVLATWPELLGVTALLSALLVLAVAAAVVPASVQIPRTADSPVASDILVRRSRGMVCALQAWLGPFRACLVIRRGARRT